MNPAAGGDRDERARLVRRALRLEYVLLSYNFLEAGIALTLGFIAGSTALVGFGFDSVIEVSATLVLVWRLRKELGGRPDDRAERRARRFIGVTFLLLAAYVLYESIEKLITHAAPDPSLPGLILAAASLLLMPVLGVWKLRIAKRIGSGALRAEAMETIVCAWLSLALLLGLGLHLLAGWWWADPAAALCMVPLMLKEGWEALSGDGCACAPAGAP